MRVFGVLCLLCASVVNPLLARDRAARMREARFGVMTHYLADWIARSSGEPMTVERWNTLLTGVQPGKCSRRDLIADLAESLGKRGIRLMVYLPGGAPNGDAAAKKALEWQNGAFRNREFQLKWEQVIREWSTRWGKKVSGWWFDGCYWPNTMYRTTEPPNFATFAAAARAGNPDAALAFNPGVFYRIFSLTPHEDFSAGEIDQPDRLQIRRAEAGRVDGAQVQVLCYLGDRWGMGAPRFTVDQVTGFTPTQTNGLLSQPYLDQLAAVGKALGRTSR